MYLGEAEPDRQRRTQGLSTEERAELVELRKKYRELERANDILQAAATFFGAELDRRHKR